MSQGHIQLINELEKETTTINLGPTHPATHGIFQNILEVDGERIMSAEPTVGYIHRAFEKIAEHKPFYQLTTLTDRMNYCSAPINNIGWHITVEKLMGVQTPKRVDYMRVIVMELARMADHIICNSIIGADCGALTGFTYIYQMREKIYDMYEEICGARLTTNLGRIGGFERNFSPEFYKKLDAFLIEWPKVFNEFDSLLSRNRIFMDRTIGAGGITAERALNYGFTGPNLRAAGVDHDVRVLTPYSSYEDFQFDIPIGLNGDAYDRYMVRQEEMRQSYSIIQQAYEKLKKEPSDVFTADIPSYRVPPKQEVYKSMEALIYHFKIIMGELDVPAGEVYQAIEGGNGEVGFYLISDGGRTPYRLHFRRPCFIYYQAYPEIIKGGLLSDAIIALSSMNVIAGELDA